MKRLGGRVIFVSLAVGKTHPVPPDTRAQLLSKSLTEEKLASVAAGIEKDVQEGRHKEPNATNHLGGLAHGLG